MKETSLLLFSQAHDKNQQKDDLKEQRLWIMKKNNSIHQQYAQKNFTIII